jgi:hypothetical protein
MKKVGRDTDSACDSQDYNFCAGRQIMDDYEDYARDEWISSLYSDFAKDVLAGRDDLYGEVINHFASERLQSYYAANPRVAERALWALDQARSLLLTHPAACLVLAVTAAEVGLKSGLLKPILHGLVHDEAIAVVIAELVPEQRNDKFQRLLFGILKEYGGIDFRTFKRLGVGPTLWEELQEAQSLRNSVVHRAEAVAPADAKKAVEVASVVVETLFPAVIAKLGLDADAQLVVSVKKR